MADYGKQPQKQPQKRAVSAKNIIGCREDITRVYRAADKEQLKNQCKCPHIGEDNQVKIKLIEGENGISPFTGARMYLCKLCSAALDISTITEEEFEKALDTITRSMDVVKMQLISSRDYRDNKIYKKLVSSQHFLKEFMMDLYKISRRRQNNNNNRRRNNGGGGFIPGRPTTH